MSLWTNFGILARQELTQLGDEVRASARCRAFDPDLWFSDVPNDLIEATMVCATCPVRDKCLALAVHLGPDPAYGVWGGSTEAERRHLRVHRLRRREVEIPDSLASPVTTWSASNGTEVA